MTTTASLHATSGSSLLGRWRAWRSARATAALMDCSLRDARRVRTLLARGADPNVKNEYGDMPLYHAVKPYKSESESEVLKALLEGGANPNERGENGDTALEKAILWEKPEALNALLDGGANPNERCENGDTPLARAVKYSKTEIVDVLLAGGALVPALTTCNPKAGDFWHVAFMALAFGSSEQAVPIARSLFAHVPESARLSVVNAALMFVADQANERSELLDLFLSLGADANATDEKLQTPLHRASERHRVPLVTCLLKHGANPTLADEIGLTPLHLCVKGAGGSDAPDEIISIIQLLADHGADVNARNHEGETALDMVDFALRFAVRNSERAKLERIRERLLSFSQEKAARQSASLDAELPSANASARGRL